MVSTDKIYAWAEEAVGTTISEIRPDLTVRWRGVQPKNLGIDADNWLALSRRMIRRFNELALDLPHVWMSEPSRAAFHAAPLISFVTAITDLADQVP